MFLNVNIQILFVNASIGNGWKPFENRNKFVKF